MNCVVTGIRTGSRVAGLTVLACALLLGTVIQPGLAHAEDKTQVDAFSGRFNHGVDIATPPFRGLEPKVSIAYSSATTSGLLGVGWGLGGASLIERAQPGRGAPKYDGSDWMYMDGQALWPCQPGSVSPSCLSGGTHSTRIESFSKIQRDSTNNRWYLWTRDGVKTTYTALMTTARGTLRWAATSRVDTKNNTVSYNWWCDGSPVLDCYLDTITYNGNTVRFYRELRPDPISFSTAVVPATCSGSYNEICYDKYGNPSVCNSVTYPYPCSGSYQGQTRYRVKTIDVLVGTSRARVYALSYTTSARTGRSLLTSVKQYGRTASVSSAGVVSGGESLPAMTHAYSSGTDALATPQPWLAASGPSGNTYNLSGQFTGDFNGDGRTDWMYYRSGWYVALSNGSSLSAPTLWLGSSFSGTKTCYQTCYETCIDKYGSPYNCNPYQCNAYTCSVNVNTYNSSYQFTGDFNADGKVDLMFYGNDGWYVALSNGTTFDGPTKWLSGTGPSGATYNVSYQFVADLNGDGKLDYMYNRSGWYVAISSGGSFAAPTLWLGNSGPTGNTYNLDGQYLVDLNGDGKVDWLYYRNGWYGALSTGAGFATPTEWLSAKVPVPGTCSSVCYSTCYDKYGTPYQCNPTACNPHACDAPAPTSLKDYQYLGDFNGDGRPDLMFLAKTVTTAAPVTTTYHGWYLALSTGAKFTRPTLWLAKTGPTGDTYNKDYQFTADLNGDGRLDWMYFRSGWYVALSNGASFGTPTRWLASSAPSTTTCYETCYRTCYDKSGAPYDCNPYNCNAYTCPCAGNTYNASYQFLGDFNGDGKYDFMYYNNGWKVALNGGTSDLLTSVANGIGGTTTVTYAPSSAWDQTYLPVGMVFPTVSAVSMADGRGDTQTTTYTYAGARWYASDREFLGFRRATVVQAATGAYSQTYYWQRAGTIAKPEAIYKRKANGAIISFEKFTFTENQVAPYTSLVTEVWGFSCNGDAVVDANHNYVSGCRRIMTKYGWDVYGNMTTEYQYGLCAAGNGDCGTTGDERTAVRSFKANPTKYIVGMPAYEDLRAGIGTGGTLLARTRFFYDGAASELTAPSYGALTKKSVYNDQTGGYLSHSFAYDAYGNETSITDPLGHVSTRTFDPTYHVYATTTKNPLNQTVTTAYDYVIGQPSSVTSVDGLVTTHAYDALGRATLSTNPDGGQVKLEYLSYGSPTAQKIRTSHLTAAGTWVWEDNYLDGVGRTYKTVSQSGITQETTFGGNGKAWRKTLPYVSGETVNCAASPPVRCDVYTYDEVGREVGVTRPSGATVTRAYGDDYSSATDATGNTRTVWYDASGRQTKVAEVIGGASKYTSFYYDLIGRRTKSVDAAGYATTATYDSVGRVLQKSDPDQGLWTYTYNDVNQVVTEKDALNQVTRLGYDAVGRVASVTYPDGTSDRFTFDESGRGYSKGRLTTAVAASGVVTRAWYDKMGRRSKFEQVVDGVAKSISHSFDVAGRVVTVTYPDGEVVTHGYHTSGVGLGRLKTLTGSVAGSLLTNVTYTSRGQLAALAYANGVTTTLTPDSSAERTATFKIGNLATIAYGYDAMNRVTSISSAALLDWTYNYDSIGRLTKATNSDGSGTQTFAYDAIGRMTNNSKVGTYLYGAAAHPHAVTTAGSLTYAYDANGNMTSGAGRTFTYGPHHRVKTITSGGLTTTMTYDADGLRVKKSSSQQTVVYVGAIYELRGAAVTKYYTAGGLRIAKRDANGNSFIHTDHLGSTRLITNSAGAEVQRYEYQPFGQMLAASGTRPDSHRFTGQEADDETGLMFYQARYYDPALGRFLQPDAQLPNASAPQELDPYQYGNNSPVNFVDPSGHTALVAAVALWLGVSAATATTICLVAGVVIGTALTFTNNPFLQTIGMVLAGACSAGLYGVSMYAGAAVALAQSPISPLDPTIKKAIGWAWTAYCCWNTIDATYKNGMSVAFQQTSLGKGSWFAAVAWNVGREVVTQATAMAIAYWVSTKSADMRFAFAFFARAFIMGTQAGAGPLSVVGASYDLYYTLKYPDGRIIDLTGGEGGEKFTFYYHTGFESGMAFGRQHIRVGDSEGGYYELGDKKAGYFGPGLGFGGWITTQKVTVIMTKAQAADFVAFLEAGAKQSGGYIGFKKDSYAYISNCLEMATGYSAADLHINPGLIHFD